MVFREIVVPLDLSNGSHVVLSVTAALARRVGVPVRLVTVVSPGIDHLPDERLLAELAGELAVPVVTTTVLSSNDVTSALLGVAAEALLAVETRARGPAAQLLLGSTTADLLHHSDRPVLLVGPYTKPEPTLSTLAVCLDNVAAADALVPVVTEWAAVTGMRVRLLHAWVPSSEGKRARDGMTAALERAAAAVRAGASTDVDWEVVTGRAPAEAIVTDARDHDAAVVVVGHRLLSALRRRTMGSVAMAVAHATEAAVLAVPVRARGSE